VDERRDVIETKVLPVTEESMAKAVRILSAGGLVAFPTDTVYGVGAHAFQPQAVEKIYAAKIRPRDKAIPLLLATPDDLSLVAESVPPDVHLLTERFWPGGLTLVLRKRAIVSNAVSPSPTVAVRVPDHPVTQALIAALGAPLAATSANMAGNPSPVTTREVVRELGGRVELVLDGGPCPGGIPSTVLDLTTDPPTILRSGAIAEADIRDILPSLRVR
jgi:L-threonylcarbamoyladenylate synthase